MRAVPYEEAILILIEDITASENLHILAGRVTEWTTRYELINQLSLSICDPLTIAIGNMKLLLTEIPYSTRALEIDNAIRKIAKMVDELRALATRDDNQLSPS